MRLSHEPAGLAAATAALKAAGDPTRFRILRLLAEGELCVCQLTEIVGLSQPTVSKHLAVLRGAGLVAERREGRWTWYRLPSDAPPLSAGLLELISRCDPDDPALLGDRLRAEALRAVPVEVICRGSRP